MLSVLINTHLLQAAREARRRALLLRLVGLRLRRRQADATPTNPGLKEADAYPAMPEDGYGWEKLFSERMCRHFREDFGLDTRVARYHNVYGPHGTWTRRPREGAGRDLPQGHRGQALRQARDRDLGRRRADAQLHVHRRLRQRHAGDHWTRDILEPINLGSSELVTINQLVDIVEDIAGVKLKRRYNLDAPKGVRGRNSDNTLIQRAPRLGAEHHAARRPREDLRWIHDQVAAALEPRPASRAHPALELQLRPRAHRHRPGEQGAGPRACATAATTSRSSRRIRTTRSRAGARRSCPTARSATGSPSCACRCGSAARARRERYRQELTFMAAQFAALPALGRPDVVVSASPSFPALLPAMVNARARRMPWVLWLHDILPDGAASTGLVDDSSPVIKAARQLERAAYRDADRIVVPLARVHAEPGREGRTGGQDRADLRPRDARRRRSRRVSHERERRAAGRAEHGQHRLLAGAGAAGRAPSSARRVREPTSARHHRQRRRRRRRAREDPVRPRRDARRRRRRRARGRARGAVDRASSASSTRAPSSTSRRSS